MTLMKALRMRMCAALGALGVLVLAVPVTVAAQVGDLAPTGQLRASVIAANSSLAVKDPATGEWTGIWIDLAGAIAQRAGVPMVIVEYATEPERDAVARTGAWDVGSSANTPEQAAALGRTSSIPYLDFDSTLAVGPNSTIRSIADMDRPGVRIGVLNGIAPEQALSALVKQAEVVRAPTSQEVAALLATGQVNAVAGNRTVVVGYAAQVPGARVLPDRYAVQQQRVPPGRSAATLALVTDVTRQSLVSGLIAESIVRAGAVGIQPASIGAPAQLPRTGTGRPPDQAAAMAAAGVVAAAVGMMLRRRATRPYARRPRPQGHARGHRVRPLSVDPAHGAEARARVDLAAGASVGRVPYSPTAAAAFLLN
jgi:polar amino acid transport system substrate-binding protein